MLLQRLFARRFASLRSVTLVIGGLLLICGSLIWSCLTVLHGHMSSNAVDFFRGLLFGIGIACEIMGIGALITGRSKENSSILRSDKP